MKVDLPEPSSRFSVTVELESGERSKEEAMVTFLFLLFALLVGIVQMRSRSYGDPELHTKFAYHLNGPDWRTCSPKEAQSVCCSFQFYRLLSFPQCMVCILIAICICSFLFLFPIQNIYFSRMFEMKGNENLVCSVKEKIFFMSKLSFGCILVGGKCFFILFFLVWLR